jgi:hypothetical protein
MIPNAHRMFNFHLGETAEAIPCCPGVPHSFKQ